MASTKRKNEEDESSDAILLKKTKISSISEPSLADLPDDLLLNITDCVEPDYLLKLEITCSKFRNVVQAWLRRSLKIYFAGFNHLRRSKSEAVSAVKQAKKIELAYQSRVNIMAYQETNMANNQKRIRSKSSFFVDLDATKTLVQLLPWDSTKIAVVLSDNKFCSIICSQSGDKESTINFDQQISYFACSSNNKIAFVLETSIVVYSFDSNSSRLVGTITMHNKVDGIGWTASDELLLLRNKSYEVRSVSGELIRGKDFIEPHSPMAVSPDGLFLIRIGVTRFHDRASVFKVDLATDTEQLVYTIPSIRQGLMYLQFIGNNPDLIYWHIIGINKDTGGDDSQFFSYNLKTNTVCNGNNIHINDISRNGTKVLERNESIYVATRSIVRVPRDQSKVDLGIPEEIELPEGKGYFQTLYHWTYPSTDNACPDEKVLAMRHDGIDLIDPETGTITSIKNPFKDESLKFCAVSRDNKTVVFVRIKSNVMTGILVWHFY